MVGLEALFARGAAKKQWKLAESLQRFLGAGPDDIRKVQRVYGIRSGFLHGETRIPLGYDAPDGDERYSSYVLRIGDAGAVAAVILTAALQRLVLADTYEF